MSNENKNNIQNTLNIGQVVGGVSQSGDVNIENVNAVGLNAEDTKIQMLEALRDFKRELENVQAQGVLDENTNDEVLTEIEQAEVEIEQSRPNTTRIIGRLKQVRDILLATAGVVGTGAFAADKLPPLISKIDKVLQLIGTLTP